MAGITTGFTPSTVVQKIAGSRHVPIIPMISPDLIAQAPTAAALPLLVVLLPLHVLLLLLRIGQRGKHLVFSRLPPKAVMSQTARNPEVQLLNPKALKAPKTSQNPRTLNPEAFPKAPKLKKPVLFPPPPHPPKKKAFKAAKKELRVAFQRRQRGLLRLRLRRLDRGRCLM